MDPYRLLTRSTSLSKGSSKNIYHRQLPSFGQSRNPQLFGKENVGDNTTYSTSRKRKRDQRATKISNEVPQEIYYPQDERGNGDSHGTTKHSTKLETVDYSTTSTTTFERMSDEKSRKILKSHKLKITLIDDGSTQLNPKDVDLKRSLKCRSKKSKTTPQKQEQSLKERGSHLVYPQPLTAFRQLATRYGMSKKLVDSIESQGFTIPTEVQLASLPLLCGPFETTSRTNKLPEGGSEGEATPPNLLVIAPTGSGKTLAFLIPLIHSLQTRKPCEGWRPKERKSEYMHWPQAVIIVPAKELAAQIVNEGRTILPSGKLKLTLMRKGMRTWPHRSVANAKSQSLNGDDGTLEIDESDEEVQGDAVLAEDVEWEKFVVQPEIIVSTPLTLINALKSNNGVIGSLEDIQHLVLDEADVLLDPLFRQQTLDIWHACTSSELHVSLWSATMGSNIEQLAKSTIKERLGSFNEPSQVRHRPLLRLVAGLKDTALPTISQRLIYAATEPGKLIALRQMIRPTASISTTPPARQYNINADLPALTPPLLIFTQTIPRAQALHTELLYDIPLSAGGSSRIACLHASLGPKARSAILARFRKAEVWILITTDLLARGMDFRGLNAVVNYDVPNSSAAYVHRVGRTGRAGREGGIAVTLYTKEDIGVVKGVANVIKASERLKRDADGGGNGSGDGAKDGGIPEWLMQALPSVSKKEKKRLKRRGVEARREGLRKNGKERREARMRISTKSGFERRVENNRRGAIESSRKRLEDLEDYHDIVTSESDFNGFDD